MGKFGVGQAIRRVEDQRFLTGAGRYTDDITVAGQAYLYMLRSSHAHADLTTVDTAAAKAAPGVLGVFTGADLDALKVGGLPAEGVPPGPDGKRPKTPLRPVLAKGRVRYVGEPIVAIVAETLTQAKDAAELVEIDYSDLPVSVGTAATLTSGVEIHPEAPGNVLVHWRLGDDAKVAAAFSRAHKVVAIDLINNRMNPTALEPRGAIGEYDAATGRYTLTQGCQNTHKLREWLTKWKVLDATAEQVRVLFLDNRNRLMADEVMGQGTVNHAPVYPREVVRRALELHATAIVLVHNHPSGDPTPSRDDITMTKAIQAACEALRITVHDHVVIGGGRWVSFRQEGLL